MTSWVIVNTFCCGRLLTYLVCSHRIPPSSPRNLAKLWGKYESLGNQWLALIHYFLYCANPYSLGKSTKYVNRQVTILMKMASNYNNQLRPLSITLELIRKITSLKFFSVFVFFFPKIQKKKISIFLFFILK